MCTYPHISIIYIYMYTNIYIYIHAYKYIMISASSKVSSRPRVLSELEEAHCCTISDCQDVVMERKKKHEDNGDVMYMMAIAWQCWHQYNLWLFIQIYDDAIWMIVMQQTTRMTSNHENSFFTVMAFVVKNVWNMFILARAVADVWALAEALCHAAHAMECPEELSEPEGGAFSNLETSAKSEPFAVQFSVFHDAFRELFFPILRGALTPLRGVATLQILHLWRMNERCRLLETFAQVSFELVSYSVGL